MKVRIRKFFRICLAVSLIGTACYCLMMRLPECFGGSDTALAAAAFTLTDGKYRVEAPTEPFGGSDTALAAAAFTLTDGKYRVEAPTEPQTEAPRAVRTEAQASTKPSVKTGGSRDKSGYYDSYGDHSGEARYSVAEKTVGADGTAVENAYVKNRTGLDFDFDSILHTPLTFRTEKNSATPQVLIYHTHTSEAYRAHGNP